MQNLKLDLVIPTYILLEYSQNYSMTSGSLWNYHKHGIDNVDVNAWDGKSFKYETKIMRKTEARPVRPRESRAIPDGSQPRVQPPIPPLNT